MITTGLIVRRTVLALLVALLGAVGLFLAFAGKRNFVPDLDGLAPMLAEGRFDELEARLRAILAIRPDHAQANMLMAQVALARVDQKPLLALESLRRVRVSSRDALAIVRLNEGKAFSALGRQNLAEEAWRDALRLAPRVPEAGWNLLGLYHVQGRREDAHRLAMRLFALEPDVHDRASLLLELLRQDVQPISAESLIRTLEPAVAKHPDDVFSTIALGRAYMRCSRSQDGLPLLRDLITRLPDNLAAWDALLASLDESSQTEELVLFLGRIPASIAENPRFARHRGALAFRHRDWLAATNAYRRAWEFDPSDVQIAYRLLVALKATGSVDELRAVGAKFQSFETARKEAPSLYDEADAIESLGSQQHADLYRRIAELRERMGRPDEALAWRRLVLADEPGYAISRAALEQATGERERKP